MKVPKRALRLQNSNWTQVHPMRRERHWTVVDIQGPEGRVVLEAVLTKRRIELGWRELDRRTNWCPGWKQGES